MQLPQGMARPDPGDEQQVLQRQEVHAIPSQPVPVGSLRDPHPAPGRTTTAIPPPCLALPQVCLHMNSRL